MIGAGIVIGIAAVLFWYGYNKIALAFLAFITILWIFVVSLFMTYLMQCHNNHPTFADNRPAWCEEGN